MAAVRSRRRRRVRPHHVSLFRLYHQVAARFFLPPNFLLSSSHHRRHAIRRVFGLKMRTMLWVPQIRRLTAHTKTRSGAQFSPFMTLTAQSFDFSRLLAESLKTEDSIDEDREPGDDDDAPDPDELDDMSLPPALDPLNAADDYSPIHVPPLPNLSRPAKRRVRTAFDDMRAGKKPQKGANRRRAARRVRKVQDSGHTAQASTTATFVRPAKSFRTALKTEALPVAAGAYAAKLKAGELKGGKKARSLSELLGLGFQLFKWNGYDPKPLVDAKGRIFAVLAGQPRTPEYAASAKRVYTLLREEATAARFSRDFCKHRRGLFAAINVGLSYGKGQKTPSFLNNGKYTPMADRLLADPDVGRFAHFASATFQLWAPRLYGYYLEHQRRLHRHFPDLRRNFPKSVFSCAAFNFGPSVWTYRHRDVLNLPFGWCAIQAAGPFDPEKGGHLVLWDLMLVIEFPPGALILLPSATITHSNVPVQDGDERVSFTQFTAGGIFRYVDNGFRTEGALAKEDPEEFARMAELKKTRWEMGLDLLSTVDELLDSPDPE
ncbi:hypothetical protein C8R43DRAFT_942621 [Mycena crocata]|nr:hypothetical protein C8R43DRAFT_942621 [Mycena crocata]